MQNLHSYAEFSVIYNRPWNQIEYNLIPSDPIKSKR